MLDKMFIEIIFIPGLMALTLFADAHALILIR